MISGRNPLQLRKGGLDVALFKWISINQVFLCLSKVIFIKYSLSLLCHYFLTKGLFENHFENIVLHLLDDQLLFFMKLVFPYQWTTSVYISFRTCNKAINLRKSSYLWLTHYSTPPPPSNVICDISSTRELQQTTTNI